MICVIPARGGSKRIHEKNLKALDGIPIIGHTIQRAIKSELFSEIYVSTENKRIATISEEFGARVIDRPSDLADDFSSTLDVMAHAVRNIGMNSDSLACCLYPVTPLLDYLRISEALNVIEQQDCNYVFPAIPLNGQIQRSLACDTEGRILKFENEKSRMRTQDLETLYADAGQFYLGKARSWLQRFPIFSTSSRVLPLKPWEVLDIDTLEDWEIMESVYHVRQAKLTKLLNGGKTE